MDYDALMFVFAIFLFAYAFIYIPFGLWSNKKRRELLLRMLDAEKDPDRHLMIFAALLQDPKILHDREFLKKHGVIKDE